MDSQSFRESLSQSEPPGGLTSAAQALWWDAKEDWARAHTCAQSDDRAEGAWVHAYLHRKEGDLGNASYWYRRAGREIASGSLENEWEDIVKALLLKI